MSALEKRFVEISTFVYPSSMSVDNKRDWLLFIFRESIVALATEFHINCKLVFARAQNYSICLTFSTERRLSVSWNDRLNFFSFCNVCLWEFITFILCIQYATPRGMLTLAETTVDVEFTVWAIGWRKKLMHKKWQQQIDLWSQDFITCSRWDNYTI